MWYYTNEEDVMNYYIITGASKGLGEKLVDKLLAEGHKVIGVSRSGHSSHKKDENYTELKMDLSIECEAKTLIERAALHIEVENAKGIYLINNAGGLDPIGPVGSLDPDAIMKSLTLNIAAPMILSNAFVKMFNHVDCRRRIVTLSSGAGKRPISGWNAYCVGKAGVDMMTRSIGLEQGKDGIGAISFGPGIMDTDMQAQIRSQEASSFKDVEMFRGFKTDGALRQPENVADLLLKVLHDDNIEPGLVTDVKEVES